MNTYGFEHFNISDDCYDKRVRKTSQTTQLRVDMTISNHLSYGSASKLKHELNRASNLYWETTKTANIFSLLWLLLVCPRMKYKFPFPPGKRKSQRTTSAPQHLRASAYCKD